jgi:hypothetical protein
MVAVLAPEFICSPLAVCWSTVVCKAVPAGRAAGCGHIRVASKQELKERITAAMDHFNQDPVVHTWSYKLHQAA